MTHLVVACCLLYCGIIVSFLIEARVQSVKWHQKFSSKLVTKNLNLFTYRIDASCDTILTEQEVSQLMPTLCDDREYFLIKGERYGKAWKRRFRHAQLHLKRKGVVTYSASAKTWSLTHP